MIKIGKGKAVAFLSVHYLGIRLEKLRETRKPQ
jgi:hypothetical protein